MFVVGARFASNKGIDTGAAYVFDLVSKTEVRKLVATDGVASDQFGFGVAIYGNIIIVSSRAHGGSGALYTFSALSGEQLQKFTNTDKEPPYHDFGLGPNQLAIHAGTDVGIVGHKYDDRGGALSKAGAVYVFNLSTGAAIRKITPAASAVNMFFGCSLFVSRNRLLVGAFGTSSDDGRVYVFDINANWTEIGFFGPSDNEIHGRFGRIMALSGPYFIVTASLHDDELSDGTYNGAVYIGNTLGATEYSKYILMY